MPFVFNFPLKCTVNVNCVEARHRTMNPTLKFEIATPSKKVIRKLLDYIITKNGKTVIAD